MQIIPKDRRTESASSKFTGVKKVTALTVVDNNEESYELLELLIEKSNLKYEAMPPNTIMAVDFKMLNLLIGKQSHGCRFSCAYCNGASPDRKRREWIPGPECTFENLQKDYDKYVAAGRIKKNAFQFHSQIRAPLNICPTSGRVIDFFKPDELHILLGIVNKLCAMLEKISTNMATNWYEKVHVRKDPHHDEFNGNSCRRLLKFSFLLEIIIR